MIKTYLRTRNKIKDLVYSFQSRKLEKTEFPEIINIETSILCNADCITCPHKHIKRKQNMELSIVKKIIDEISLYPVKEVHPFNYGEPFLYPNFIQVLKYLRSKTKSEIFIYSNGSAMTDVQVGEVVKNHLIDKVNFSIDAAEPETYKNVRRLDYSTTLKKVLNFIEVNSRYGNKIQVSVSFVINSQNERELGKFKKFWKGKARVHLAADDGREGKPFINRASKYPCSWLFNRIVVLTTGQVVPCCIDASGKLILGNVNKNSIKEIWDSPAYEKIRQLHLQGKKDIIPLCSKCSVRY